MTLDGWEPIETAPRDGTRFLVWEPWRPDEAWVGRFESWPIPRGPFDCHRCIPTKYSEPGLVKLGCGPNKTPDPRTLWHPLPVLPAAKRET